MLITDIHIKQGESKLSEVHWHTQVAGAWTERQKMFLGGSFLKLADDDV